jgi:hypothetical protein
MNNSRDKVIKDYAESLARVESEYRLLLNCPFEINDEQRAWRKNRLFEMTKEMELLVAKAGEWLRNT